MEGIARIVSESLARHGFDRPIDYRRLHWSRWFRCESHHSLLVVPSKPGVFALAEEIMPACADVRDEAIPTKRRMLAVAQFLEADDMAFVLDRMLSRRHPMGAKLLSGRYFVRFVIIEDEAHRHSICSSLNQWIAGEGEKASGIGAHFATSLELTENNLARTADFRLAQTPSFATAGTSAIPEQTGRNGSKPTAPPATAPQLDSGAATNFHCPFPFPAGF
jgi:hypothetical protein